MHHQHDEETVPDTLRDAFERLPGLFRRWEIEQVIHPGSDFHLEEAGNASDGTPLFALYQRTQLNPNPNQEK